MDGEFSSIWQPSLSIFFSIAFYYFCSSVNLDSFSFFLNYCWKYIFNANYILFFFYSIETDYWDSNRENLRLVIGISKDYFRLVGPIFLFDHLFGLIYFNCKKSFITSRDYSLFKFFLSRFTENLLVGDSASFWGEYNIYYLTSWIISLIICYSSCFVILLIWDLSDCLLQDLL